MKPHSGQKKYNRYAAVTLTIIAILLVSCTRTIVKPESRRVIKGDEFIITTTLRGDSLRSLARLFLGDESKYWIIADFNAIESINAGQEIVIPRTSQNPVGVFTNGYQQVPILVYHRFGLNASRMVVTPQAFANQMAYLNDNGYRVIKLKDLTAFIEGKKSLPLKSVVITADDGYKSTYQYAFPILRKYGFPATLFVYSDFIGAPGGLRWDEMRDMVASRLIDIQPHSKSHSNLAILQKNESRTVYRNRIEQEVTMPSGKIKKYLKIPLHTYAYPYGDTNKDVIKQLQAHQYELAVTVQPGSNPSFAYPYMLQRTMIFGNQDLETFKRKLEVFQKVDLR